MAKRAAAACQSPEMSPRPQTRRKKTPDDVAAAPGLSSCSCSATSTQAEKPPRPGKKKPNTARKVRHSCATAAAAAAAQARLRRDLSISWGASAKRRRTVRSGPAVGARWRDWAGLDEGPTSLIADRVLAGDVADYLRFRATCLPWRRCCADPRAHGALEDPRLFPRHWIMLRDDYENHLAMTAADDDEDAAPHGILRRRRFLNTRTGECVQVDVPELRDSGYGVLRAVAAADGLLVLHRRSDKDVRLLNPLTRQTAELPPTTTGELAKFSVQRAGLLDHRTVYLCSYRSMAIARPGDDRWALLDAGRASMRDAVFFAGRFYGLTGGDIVTVDMAGDGDDDRGRLRLVVAAERPKQLRFRAMTDTVPSSSTLTVGSRCHLGCSRSLERIQSTWACIVMREASSTDILVLVMSEMEALNPLVTMAAKVAN